LNDVPKCILHTTGAIDDQPRLLPYFSRNIAHFHWIWQKTLHHIGLLMSLK